ncbi:MAG TPA: redox-regulated ATPase YchF [Patescibacteria group bacterium]|nr:redox-regulated ATPase YchF [Patescibacteria group bacterium]
MKIGLVGLPLVGKTTFFNLLTNAHAEISNFSSGKTSANIGTAKIPDHRIDFLSAMYKPKKITYAQIDFIDVPGLVSGSSSGKGIGNQFLEDIRKVDALVHIVRAFENPDVLHSDGSIDPIRDIENISLELLFADLGVIDNRIARIQSTRKVTKENLEELEVLKKCKDGLEKGQLLHQIKLTEDEKELLKSFSFLSEKPTILVINLDESGLKDKSYIQKENISNYAAERNIPMIEVCAKTEMEISELPEEDRAMFMEELGIEKSGIDILSSTAYTYMGLISFLTAGEDEVRAWTIKKDTDAKKAAGKIHSDIERGFIRAEVIKYNDLHEHGTTAKLREKGLFHLEGKEYIIHDGDIINFRFNV